MRAGGDARGSTADRLRRKLWMLRAFGDGVLAPCAHCGRWLPACGLEADRVEPGGPYRRGNIVPSCPDCNRSRGDAPASPALVQLAQHVMHGPKAEV